VRRVDLFQRQFDESEPAAQDEQTPSARIAALSLPTKGAVFDLDAGRWPGMPILDVHPPYVQTTYRTPRGARIDGDMARRYGANPAQMGVITEWISASSHSGTHIDARCHITTGGTWFGGVAEDDALGDFGAKTGDAASIPPIISRGVLIDAAAHLGVDRLPGGQPITVGDLEGALEAQRVGLDRGDAVLIRTGYMAVWGRDETAAALHYGAGIDREAARWLAAHEPCAIGADTENLEQVPTTDATCPLPAHVELLVKRGIYIIELLYLEALANARVYEFLFLCLPLRLRGATGSMVRPVAVA
jgi:kynurenine formamidase